jgi:PAS domain S-box-containing protein
MLEKAIDSPDVSTLPTQELQALVHELRVHQIELEMQNDELKRVQLALETSRDKFRRMFESHSAIMLLVEPETGRIVDANIAAERFYGYTTSQLRSMSIQEINVLSPDEVQALRNLALKDLCNYAIFPHRLASGEVRTVEVHSSPIEHNGELMLFSIIHDITESKRIEAALRASEQRWQFALEGSRDGVWDWNAQTNEVFFSRQWKAMLGFEEHEIGTTLDEWDKRLHPDDKESCYGDIERHFSGEMPFYQNEHRVLCKDGNYKWILDRGKVMEWMDDGKPLRVIGTHTDITDRKRTEEALRKSEEIFKYFMEYSPIYIFFKDENLRSLRLSKNFETMLGKPVVELLGKSDDELFSSEFAKSIVADDMRVMKEGKGITIEEELNGRFYSTTKFPIIIDGNPRYLAGYIIDITERKQAAEALRQSEDKFSKTFHMNPDAILITRIVDGMIVMVNEGFMQIFGATEEEVIGKTARELNIWVNPEDRNSVIEGVKADGKVNNFEFSFRNKAGDVRYGLMSASIIEINRAPHILTVARDITKRVRAEEERESLRSQLFQSQKMEALGTLVGGIAHDFNNMLQIMMGYCDMLLSDKKKGEPGYNDLQTIIETGKGGAELVKKLLAFGQQGQIFPVPLELNHQISQLATLISQTLPHVVQVDLDLIDGPATICADHGQIDQLVMNLAINASEAMPIGGRLKIATATICLDDEYCRTHHGSKPGGYVMLTVSDTGRGMDQEILVRIFDPFFSTKERGSTRGTGLGLSVVKGIVQQQGGHVTCESEPGKGTTVKVYFPAVEAPLISVKTAVQTVLSEGTETILVVEDNIPVAELERRFLANAGYEVIVATNGKEALDIYQTRKEEISLVILDILMPEMSGRDCLMELLKIDPSVKVIIASGYAPEDELLRDISPLVKGFLHKPFAISTLPADVRSVLDSD